MIETPAQRELPLVLVVDDDMAMRRLMCESLEQAGFAVEETENGVQALSAFELLRPDLVLLDVMMPEMDGFTACTDLRQLPSGKRTPVFMVTGLDDLESINRAYKGGATDFLTKPINWVVLGHRVRYMLRASKAIDELHRSEAKNRALVNAIPDLPLQISKNSASLEFRADKGSDPLVPLPG